MGKVDRLELLNIHVPGTADFVWGQVLPTPVQTMNDLLLEKQILSDFGSNSDVVHVILREN